MLRSIAELLAYGVLAVLLTVSALTPEGGTATSSATTTADIPNFPASGATVTATAARGQMLFAAKGCVGCHTHRATPNAGMQVGPDLSDLAARATTRVPGLGAADYVRQSLRDPGAYRVLGYNAEMPDLALSDEEIEALRAFLLGGRG